MIPRLRWFYFLCYAGVGTWLAYFALVGVALVFAAGLEGTLASIRTAPPRPSRLTARLLLLGLSAYALASLSASPVLRRYDQWPTAGQVIDRFAQSLSQCVAGAPQANHVRLHGANYACDRAGVVPQ